MSMTYNEIITAALVELKRIGDGQTPKARQSKKALEVLNGMMAEYAVNNVDFNWFEVKLADIDETAPIGEEAREAIISLLAVNAAPRFSARISPELGTKARRGEDTITRMLMHQQLGNTDMSHMPLGSGYYRGKDYDITTDQ